MPPPVDPAEIAADLCRSAEEARWTGPDIYDALGASWPRMLTAGKRRRQALIQLHARAPVDLRRLSRSSHRPIAKALAVFALADLRLGRLGGAGRASSATAALDILAADDRAGADAWGYPWDMQTRWSHYGANTPNVIVSAFAISALTEGAASERRPDYADRAARAASWIHERLFAEDLGVYVYHPGSRAVIHNATLLGARAAWSVRDREPGVLAGVKRAVERTLAAQRPDGSFPYGEGPGLEFVDSFHTAYVLECLTDLRELDPAVLPALERGAAFYVSRFFDGAGRARLWPGRAYPEDAHSAGSGLTALRGLREADLVDSALIELVARRAARAMVRRGHAVHRRYRWGRTRVTYVRWADSHLALGLANAAVALAAGRER